MHALSPEMEALLGISGFIQRSIPARFVAEQRNVRNLDGSACINLGYKEATKPQFFFNF